MRIVRIEAWPVHMHLREPYTIAYETITEATNVFLRVVPDSGPVGLGVAAPDLAVTRETVAATLDGLREVDDRLRGADPLERASLVEQVAHALPEQPSLRAAVDIALHDLLGKVAGQPLWKVLGGYRSCIETSFTIGILPLEETVERARAYVAAGARVLKLKGGLDVTADIAKIHAVRSAVGAGVSLRFDANQGYSVEQALALLDDATDDLDILEQPTPKHRHRDLGRVTDNSEIPVMADESLMSLEDAMKLAVGERVDMVNIKLQKVGGILEASRMDAVAMAANLRSMVGCMDESALGIAAGLAFALARPNVQAADLDGHFDLLGDPAAGCVRLEHGVLYPSDQPGLGLDDFEGGPRGARPSRSPVAVVG